MKYYNGTEWQECLFKRPHYNILMIGNSFCYYFVEELCGIANKAGIDLDIYNIYKSGCTIQEHYNSLKNNNEIYQLWHTDKNKKEHTKINEEKNWDLKTCLSYNNIKWDIISLQEHFNPNKDEENKNLPNLNQVKELYDYLKQLFPRAKLYWHETWAYEIGHKYKNQPNPNPTSKDQQQEQQKIIYKRSIAAAAQGPAKLIPAGEAWAAARENPWLGQEMCIRSSIGNDYYHDGDLGGGQYLNACVWFETLFNRSCIGNSWRPSNYSLIERKIHAAQQIAHNVIK